MDAGLQKWYDGIYIDQAFTSFSLIKNQIKRMCAFSAQVSN